MTCTLLQVQTHRLTHPINMFGTCSGCKHTEYARPTAHVQDDLPPEQVLVVVDGVTIGQGAHLVLQHLLVNTYINNNSKQQQYTTPVNSKQQQYTTPVNSKQQQHTTPVNKHWKQATLGQQSRHDHYQSVSRSRSSSLCWSSRQLSCLQPQRQCGAFWARVPPDLHLNQPVCVHVCVRVHVRVQRGCTIIWG